MNKNEIDKRIKRFLERRGYGKDVHELFEKGRHVENLFKSGKLTKAQADAVIRNEVMTLTPEQKELRAFINNSVRLNSIATQKINEMRQAGKFDDEQRLIDSEFERGYTEDFESLESKEDRDARIAPFKQAFEEDPSVENAAKLMKESTYGTMTIEQYNAMQDARRQKERHDLEQKMRDNLVLEAAKEKLRKQRAEEDAKARMEIDDSWKEDKRLKVNIKQPKGLEEFEKKVDALIESGEVDMDKRTDMEKFV